MYSTRVRKNNNDVCFWPTASKYTDKETPINEMASFAEGPGTAERAESEVADAYRGCFLATCPLPIQDSRYSLPDWALGVDECAPEEEGDGPDLTIDPEDGVLSVINGSDSKARSYFVTVDNCAHVLSAGGEDLLGDVSAGTRRQFVTFVVLLPPCTMMDLVTLVPKAAATAGGAKKKGKKKKASGRLSSAALQSIGVFSDVQEYVPAPAAGELAALELQAFPLQGSAEAPAGWLCTQASAGPLTHFAHPSTYHAVDFRCDAVL